MFSSSLSEAFLRPELLGDAAAALLVERHRCVQANQRFLDCVLEAHSDHLPSPLTLAAVCAFLTICLCVFIPGARQLLSTDDGDSDKVRSTLMSCMRDWSAEGAAERDECYGPMLAALLHHVPLCVARIVQQRYSHSRAGANFLAMARECSFPGRAPGGSHTRCARSGTTHKATSFPCSCFSSRTI